MHAHLDGIDDYFERALAERGIPGAALAVVQGDELLYAAGYGVKEIGGRDSVDEHSLFQVGSTTKAFTATALGMLVDERKLHWDDSIITHLQDFRLYDPWLTKNVTIRDTLTHRSGFMGGSGGVFANIDSDEVLRRMRYVKKFAPFRDSFNYSNDMYEVAGRVIEAVSGMTWREFVRSRLLVPLGMTRSGTSPFEFWDEQYVAHVFYGTAAAPSITAKDARDQNVAMPHRLDEGAPKTIAWQSYDNMGAAGAIVSSARDMAQWLMLHVNGGRYRGKTLLQDTTLLELHRPQNVRATSLQPPQEEFPFDKGSGAYTLGWQRATYRGHPYLAHGGGMLGFPACAFVFPGSKLGIVVLANGFAPEAPYVPHLLQLVDFHKSVALWIIDRFLGTPAYDWHTRLFEEARAAKVHREQAEVALQASRLRDTHPSLELKAYSGQYEDVDELLGGLEIYCGDVGLRLRFPGDGAFSGDLEHWHHDIFRLNPDNGVHHLRSFVVFELDQYGKIATVNLSSGRFRRRDSSE